MSAVITLNSICTDSLTNTLVQAYVSTWVLQLLLLFVCFYLPVSMIK